MITVSPADLQSRLDEVYASQNADRDGAKAAALVYRRGICSPLPPASVGPGVDLGCRRGGLVRLPRADDFDAEGIDICAEQAVLACAAGVSWVRQGAPRTIRAAYPARYVQITVRRLL